MPRVTGRNGGLAVIVLAQLAGACTRKVVESSVSVVSDIGVRDGALLVKICRLDYKEETESPGEAIAEELLSGGHDVGRDTYRSGEMGCILDEVGELQHVVLTRYADAAAVDGDCAAVQVYARRVQLADAMYFQRVFMANATTVACLAQRDVR